MKFSVECHREEYLWYLVVCGYQDSHQIEFFDSSVTHIICGYMYIGVPLLWQGAQRLVFLSNYSNER